MFKTMASASSHRSLWREKLTAILEIVGVYMVGQLLAFLVLQLLGVHIQNPIETLKQNPHADLLSLSGSLALILILQYGFMFILAVLLGRWRNKKMLCAYGFQPSSGIGSQLLSGLVLFFVSALPLKLMTLFDQFHSLGQKAVTQEIVYSMDWNDYRFWIFLAVGSFALIPIVEEFFFRGYVQTRLAENFSVSTAIIVTALFFEFSHGQYLSTASFWTVGCIVTGIYSSVIWGVVFYQTRSLLVTVVAHALVNFPVAGIVNIIVPVLMIILIVVYRKQIIKIFAEAFMQLKKDIPDLVSMIVLGLFFIGFALVVTLAQDFALLFGIISLPSAILLTWAIKQRNKKKEVLNGPT